MSDDPLEQAAQISDPAERARFLGGILPDAQARVERIARARRQAIDQALASGMTQEQLAVRLGVSPGRISQVRKAAVSAPVTTGWHLPADVDQPPYRIAICGSRSAGVDGEVIDTLIRSLAGLLMRRRCTVSHGPVGVGTEVLTYLADHYRPPGFGSVSGVFGHDNVVRDADHVLIIGGGEGTQAEAELALAMGKQLLPMPASGGTAARMYTRLEGDETQHRRVPAEAFTALRSAGPEEYIRILDEVISLPASQRKDG